MNMGAQNDVCFRGFFPRRPQKMPYRIAGKGCKLTNRSTRHRKMVFTVKYDSVDVKPFVRAYCDIPLDPILQLIRHNRLPLFPVAGRVIVGPECKDYVVWLEYLDTLKSHLALFSPVGSNQFGRPRPFAAPIYRIPIEHKNVYGS